MVDDRRRSVNSMTPVSPSRDPGGLRTSPLLRPLRPLIITAAVVMVTASLAWARDVLIAIALAMLLAFVLSPVTNALQRRFGRVPSVLVVVVLAFSLLGGAAWALSQQVSTLGGEIPKYTAAVKEKVAGWRRHGAGRLLGHVRSSVDEVVDEIQKVEAPPRREKPMPVVIQGTEKSRLETITAVAEPLTTVGFVAILIVFMLLERVELRNRFIRLVGYGHLTLTTKALDEASERISRYLLGQVMVNGGLAIVFGLGLYAIGVPYALVWGVLLGVLRFIPYVGVWLGVLPPILISLASFDGWTKPLLVVGLFTVLELALGGFIEPVLYFASDYARDTRTSGSSSAAGGPRPRAGRAGMSCCPRAPTTSVPASSRCAISCRGSRPWRRPPGRRHSAFRSFHRSARRPSAAHLTLPRTVAAILLR